MSSLYFESCIVNANTSKKNMVSLSIPRSPICDIQSFYENFNPDNNDDYMFSSPGNQSNETHGCNERLDSISYFESEDSIEQITPEPDQSRESNITSCNNWNHLNNEVFAKKVQDLNSTHTNCNQIKKTIVKKKRKRTMFTTEQIVAMEKIFKTRPYICREERLKLAQRIHVSERVIKVWFQNRRRMSEKREKSDLPDSPLSIDMCDSNSERLVYIESLINERTDQLGNVMLDNHILTELVSVIDDYLSREAKTLLNSNSDSLRKADLIVIDSIPVDHCSQKKLIMYEPISPSSVSDEYLF